MSLIRFLAACCSVYLKLVVFADHPRRCSVLRPDPNYFDRDNAQDSLSAPYRRKRVVNVLLDP